MTILYVLLVFSSGAFAAADSVNTAQDTVHATLSVQSSTPGVRVYIDSLMIGTAPLLDVAVVRGTHVLTFVHSTTDNWFVPSVAETIAFSAGERVERNITFPSVYHVTSDPYGASVQFHDSLVGHTPLMFSTYAGKGVVTFSKNGYEDVNLPLTADGGVLHAVLVSKTGESTSALVNGEQMKSLTPIYLSSGAAIICGTAAAYFKIKADGYYNDYRNTGDESALQRVRKFDTISGVALVTSEISLLLLSYFLLSR